MNNITRLLRKIVLIGSYALFFAPISHAQAVGPVSTDCSAKCSGSYLIQNPTLTPMQFSIEAFSLHFKNAGPVRSALEPSVTVVTAPSSGRLGPKSIIRVSFQIRCEVMPCIVQFQNAFTAGHTANGIAVKIALPHTVYITADGKKSRQLILTTVGLFPAKK